MTRLDPNCIGICLTAAELGVEGGSVIAIPHPDCEVHGEGSNAAPDDHDHKGE